MTQPPRLAERLLDGLSGSTAFSEGVIGDLAEEHARRVARDGDGSAWRWYHREALRSAPHIVGDAMRSFRRADLRVIATGVLAAWGVVVVVALADRATGSTVSHGLRFVLRLAGVESDIFFAAAIHSLLVVLLGGAGAARFSSRMPILSSTAFGLTAACSYIPLVDTGEPVAFVLAYAAGSLIAAAVGGVFLVSLSRPRSRAYPPTVGIGTLG
jgi:hypothetical protein